MSLHNLEKMLKPKAVAVVGGGSHGAAMAGTLVSGLRKGGYTGGIFPVVGHPGECCGLTAYAAVTGIGRPVDLALIASPFPSVPAVLRECSEAGIPGAVVFADGHGLAAEDRAAVEHQIKAAASQGSVRVIGPGSAGVCCTAARLAAGGDGNIPLAGKLAFISQSRTIYHAILDLSVKDRIGFSYFISSGGMLDVDLADLINFLGNDERVSSIALYLEQVTHFRKFMSAARAVSRIKPIVALKSGRADLSERCGPLPGSTAIKVDDIYGAAFKRAGIERVHTFAELFDCADLLAKSPRPSASGLVIVTNGRGPGRMAADALADRGVALPPLHLETTKGLSAVLSPAWTKGNPVDMGGEASPERYAEAVRVCLAASETEALLIILVPHTAAHAILVAESLVKILRGRKIPVCAVWMGAGEAEQGREILNRAGIPAFETPERAIKGFLHMGSYAHNLKMLQELPEKLPRGLEFDAVTGRAIIRKAVEGGMGLLDDEDSEALLKAYGIPVERGGTKPPGCELMLGVRRDPGFGPILLCGLGAAVGEVFRDCALALPPLNRVLARQLIEASLAYPLLKGNRNRPPANLVLLEEILIRLAQLVTELPEVVSLDLNPLLLTENAAVAADAKVLVEPAAVAVPQHLVISSYPRHYEIEAVTRGGQGILLRPIKPEDAPLLVELFHSLSPTSVYFRFFSPMRELPPTMLARFTQIDYDRDIVVVASKQALGDERILGVARLMSDPDVTSAEFAIAVGDAWQKQGIGTALLERAIHIAKERKLEFIWGTVLSENKAMLDFARSHGFALRKIHGGNEYEVRIDLDHPSGPASPAD